MPLARFAACIETVEQVEAAERIAFVTDLGTVVSGAFAGKGKNPIKEHVDLLDKVRLGKRDGNES